MGKKSGSNKRKHDEDDAAISDDESNELDAELAAVLAMRNEKALMESSIIPDSTEGENVALVLKNTYNKQGLVNALETIGTTSLSFAESLQVCKFEVSVHDENDDLAREMAFYNQSVEAVKHGRNQMERLGLPTRRPADYFCENLKSDSHMSRIKDKLILEEKKNRGF